MEHQSTMASPQSFLITLAIGPDDMQDTDPAAIHALGQHTVAELRQEGYTLDPVYTGQRGGIELLFQITAHALQTGSTDILAQKDALDVLGSLCTILETVKPIIHSLFRTRGPQEAPDKTIKVSIKIDGAEIDITSGDMANDERVMQLAERFLAKHPTTHAHQKSAVHIQGRVPKQKTRRRR